MVKNVFTEFDLIIGPILLIILIFIAFIFSFLKYKFTNKNLYIIFNLGLIFKFIGCLSFIAIYSFYYKGGDTFDYFNASKPLTNFFWENPIEYFKLISQHTVPNYVEDYQKNLNFSSLRYLGDRFFGSKAGFLVIKITSILNIFSLNTYLGTSLLLAFLSYLGNWAMFRTFSKQFPHLNPYLLALPILFLPSVFFWGSPIMKDTLVFSFLGFFVYSIYQLFFLKNYIIFYLIFLITSTYVLFTTKEYIIITYIPALIIWLLLGSINNLKQKHKIVLRPLFLLLILSSIGISLPIISKFSSSYSIENVLATSELTATYLSSVSERLDGSGYTIEIEYTPIGLLKAFPAGVIVTLFRPFLFEVKNPVMLISALEGLFFLLFTIYAVFKVGFFRFIKKLINNPFLLSSLIFSLFFAFAIGISTFNFGSLARYKLPCLPFYLIAFIVPLYESIQEDKTKKQGLN